jgi:hypothetical protein
VLTPLVAALAALATGPPLVPAPPPRQEEEVPADAPAPVADAGQRWVELALSSETAWVAFGFPVSGSGEVQAGVLVDSDEDFLALLRFVRTGRPLETEALELGVGLAGYVTSIHAQAVALVGTAAYDLPVEVDARLALELAYAPRVTTFDDGEDLLDLLARFEIDLSAHATLFAGYRLIDVDRDERRDRELEHRAHVGIRLGF